MNTLPRLILSLDRDYIFYTAFYEQDIESIDQDYYEKEDPLNINNLPLSKELQFKLQDWHDTFNDSIDDNFIIESKIMLMAIETLGSILYERVREELKDKYYIVYSPYSSIFNEENYPVIVDNN